MDTNLSKKVVATVFVALTVVGAGAAVSGAYASGGDDNHPHATDPHHK